MRALTFTVIFTITFIAPFANAKMQSSDESFELRNLASDFSRGLKTDPVAPKTEVKEKKIEAETAKTEAQSSSAESVAQESKAESTPTPSIERNWSGPYVGAILGAQFGRSSTKTGSFGYNADNNEWKYKNSGFNAGAEVGYNFTASNVVFGPELELGYLSVKGNGAQPLSPGSDTKAKTSSDFYSALRARVGADFSHFLVFASGGFIGINSKNEVVDNCEVAPCGGTTVSAQKKGLDWGYTFGGGVEHLFTNKWSLKIEYLYFDLGQRSLSGTTNLGDQYEWKSKTSGHIVRVGANINL